MESHPDSSPFTFFFEGDHYFSGLRQVILTAKNSIDIEIYYLGNDDLGWGFVNLLASKAEQGVKVRLIYDSLGCQRTSIEALEILAEKGVQMKSYHPVFPWFRKLWYRNHRKMTVIDGKTVFLGGFNLSSEYSFQYSWTQAWRDTGVRIDDSYLAQEGEELFRDSWRERKVDFRRFFRLRQKLRKVDRPHLIANYGVIRRNLIRHAYLVAIRNAQRQIWITNSYFVPDRRILRRLTTAARSGVDVRLLTAGKTDVRVARWAGQATYSYLLKAGVRIFEYQPRVLHAKSAVIDGKWFTVGTFNLDHLSFFHNLEVNLIAQDEASARILNRRFKEDLAESSEISRKEWEKRSFFLKFLARFFYIFRFWL